MGGRQAKLHRKRMRELFSMLDATDDGSIDIDEFLVLGQIPEITQWLSALDLDAKDLTTLFHLIDADGSGLITVDELIQGVEKLRGPARNLDLMVGRDAAGIQVAVSSPKQTPQID